GIGMIHQHFMLVESLTVAENVALGLPSSRGPLTDLERVSKRVLELAETYGLQVDPDVYIWQLAVGQRQRVEIIKALYRGAALLILDEPTSVLTPQEVDEFFVTIRQMVRDGHAIIFISHKLHEVIDISNRVTVLRDGKRIDSCATDSCTKGDLARMMVGREVTMQPERAHVERGEVRLALKDLHAQSDRETPACAALTLNSIPAKSWDWLVSPATVSGNWPKSSPACVRPPGDRSFWKART
ncbi:MAG: ATP-binding cassette domain-containing protein, partial [Anaerolineae bacterium]|nr:ATP-binding cassette domain-containing protein [Anaerolineae bacterium]